MSLYVFYILTGLNCGLYILRECINSHMYIREFTKGRYLSYIHYNYGFHMELYYHHYISGSVTPLIV